MPGSSPASALQGHPAKCSTGQLWELASSKMDTFCMHEVLWHPVPNVWPRLKALISLLPSPCWSHLIFVPLILGEAGIHWWREHSILASNVLFPHRRQTFSWYALGKAQPAGWGKGSFPSAEHWWGHTCIAGYGSRLHRTREIWTYWTDPSKGPQRWWRYGTTVWQVAQRTGTAQLGTENAQGRSHQCLYVSEGWVRREWCQALLSGAVGTDWTTGSTPVLCR